MRRRPAESIFRELKDMPRDMERIFEETARYRKGFKGAGKEISDSPAGRVREVGPLVYGYSVTTEPDGKPKGRQIKVD